MSSYSVYILHSETLNRYYVGYASDLDSRLEKHQAHFYSNSFTSKADDWELFLSIGCETKAQAMSIEKYIKSMKSTVYIQNLKKYPEMTWKLLSKFKP